MSIFSKHCLGIDIGASSIKVVEVSSIGKKYKLENYAKFSLPVEDDESGFKTFDPETFALSSQETAQLLKLVLKEGGFKEKKAGFSIPDFSTFFTSFTLPPMTREEIPQAVEFEARHHIPLPLSKVVFDWQVTQETRMTPGVRLKILLVAVPSAVLRAYQELSQLTGLEVKGIEAEVFGLIRSSVPRLLQAKTTCLIDIGYKTTTISIVDKGVLQVSHSINFSAQSLSERIKERLKISLSEAEKLKRMYGLDPTHKDISDSLAEEIDILIQEIEKVTEEFSLKEKKRIEDLIVAGGTAMLFGLKEYLESRLHKKIYIADPFSNFSYPLLLQERLKKIGPSFAVAAGVGLMGLES